MRDRRILAIDAVQSLELITEKLQAVSWWALPLEDLTERQRNLGQTFDQAQDAFHIALAMSKALLFLDERRLREAVTVLRLRTNTLALLAAGVASRPQRSEVLRSYSESLLAYVEKLRAALGDYVVAAPYNIPTDPGQPDFDAAT